MEAPVSVRVLFDRMGWSVEDALCVGDAPNDLPMFALLRWSVAVGGAFDAVSAAASVQSPHPHGATFHRWLMPFLSAGRGWSANVLGIDVGGSGFRGVQPRIGGTYR